METHQLLGQLSGLHQMMGHLAMSVPEPDAYRRFHPELPPLTWLLGRCVYRETDWIREVVQQDDEMTSRVRALFGDAISPDEAVLPPWRSVTAHPFQRHPPGIPAIEDAVA